MRPWGRWVRPWTLLSWCFLTGGISLGSWWAYYELGWGGFWFWDPVENASLLPWLTGTALLHSAIVVEKREALKVWTVLLAIGTFSLSLSGTFLVRSGILNSVHAFASDPTRGRVHPGAAGDRDRRQFGAVCVPGFVFGVRGRVCACVARGRVGVEQHPAVLDRCRGDHGDDVSAVQRFAVRREAERGRAVLQRNRAAAGRARVPCHDDRPRAGVEAGVAGTPPC